MKVTTEDIRKIPCGCTITFKCDSPKGVNNAKATVSYCKTTYGEEDKKSYTTSTKRSKNEISITAVSRQIKKQKTN